MGHAETCRALLGHQRFTQADAKDHRGDTALHKASEASHAEACIALSTHPRFSALSTQNVGGSTALACAENEEIRQILRRAQTGRPYWLSSTGSSGQLTTGT